MKRLFIAALVFIPSIVWAGDEDDFGTWLELGVEKVLPHNLSVGIEGELRTQDNSSRVDRWNLGANLGYKPNKHLKFGVAYNFIDAYSPEKTKDHYKNDDGTTWNGYNIIDKYWKPKHRFSFDVTGTVKLWKWLRISVRERYQFTHYCEVDYTKTKYRYTTTTDGETGETTYELKDGYPETVSDTSYAENKHILRSRVKLSYDKKGVKWEPFVSCEFHNRIDDAMNLDKIRTSIGTEYKINKQHHISMAYTFTTKLYEDPNERMHAINIGYQYKF